MDTNIGVLIVDDSTLVRQVLTNIVEKNPDMYVIKAVKNPVEAVEIMRKQKPDIVLLDIEMPKMDGLTFLKRIMKQHPMNVIIISSLVSLSDKVKEKAFETGARDVIEKPKFNNLNGLGEFEKRLYASITGKTKPVKRNKQTKKTDKNTDDNNIKAVPKQTIDEILPLNNTIKFSNITDPLIVMGASTGGIVAMEKVLQYVNMNTPPIVVVQHIPANFTSPLAQRLNSIYDINIVEGEYETELTRGTVYIAKGGFHSRITRRFNKYYISQYDNLPVNRHKPSIDVLFRSASISCGINCIAILLTGMGDDGARAMLDIRRNGGVTIAQDEKTSVVWGMPRRAIEIGAADKVLSIDEIGEYIHGLS
ncbi:MAG: chemotaxis-specific protein-glutamate methyltransferase CheB [Bacteroidales bacterium]|jgi:two-component system chemotaxis response regulator CheB|nr:chemotaxis-specific protein-glutamate methyltransferase CheB [Bacteroidales bacterium]